jgi:SAM-dependent methyltransferase
MPWWYHVVESKHELQNPTSAEKIRLLGQRMGLGPRSHVLDMGSGRGGPALILAEAFHCRITCVERSDEFVATARERIVRAGFEQLIDIVHQDGREFRIEPDRYHAALCLGASFIWDGLPGALNALTPGVKAGGFVAVGEPYWRRWPLPGAFTPDPDERFEPLLESVARIEAQGLPVISLIAASEDDWDRYETLHWDAIEEWLSTHPDDPDSPAFRERATRHRERYLRWERELVGWAIFAGRKP